ncbi:MAG: O-antigen ligase family protein [Phaeodactylibacter sp.]|uniref:O-antigen ligase family protein n=1 Tax=Phaeodactylibacter sp. TaxID=1940289 RepID=UPI0032ED3BF8
MTNKNESPAYPKFFMAWVIIGLFFSGFVFDPGSREAFLPVRQFLISIWLLAGTLGFSWIVKKPVVFSSAGKTFLILSGLFLAWCFLSTTWAYNPTEALLVSNRVLLQVGLIAFFVLFYRDFTNPTLALSRVFSIYLVLLSALSIGQYTGWTVFPYESSSPPIGLSGNRNLLGSTLIILLPWALHLFLTGSRYWSFAGLLSLATGTAALLLSQTRSAWVAFIVAFLVMQVLLLIARKRLSGQVKQRWKVGSIAVIAGVIGIIGFLTLSGQGSELKENLRNRMVSLVQVPSAGAEAANEAERNILDRYHLWQHTLELIKAHPLKGVGAGNWKIEFPKYGGSSAARFEEKDKLRVRPHNEYLSISSELGLVGLLLFLSLMATTAFSALKLVFRTNEEQKLISGIVLVGIGTGLAVDFVFSFALERMGHSYLIALNTALALQWSGEGKTSKRLQGMLAGLLGLLALAAAILSYYNWQTNRSLHQLLRAEVAGQWEKAIAISQETERMPLASLDPVGDPIEWHSANALKQLGKYDAALTKIDEAIKVHPGSHRVWNTRAAILIQQNQFQAALPALDSALQLAPDYEPALSNLGYARYRTDQFEQAIAALMQLDLQQHSKWLPVIWDAGERMERNALQDNAIYQAGLTALKANPPLPKSQWPGRVKLLREQFPSDEAFVKAYFDTFRHYVLFKAWQEKPPPEDVIRLKQALDKVTDNLGKTNSYSKITALIMYNDHLQTLSAIGKLPETGMTAAEDLLFPF